MSLRSLEVVHPEQMSQVERGSQKIFFRRMWQRIQEKDGASEEVTPIITEVSETPKQSSSPEADGKEKTNETVTEETDVSSKIEMTPKHHELKTDGSATRSPGYLSVGTTTGNSAKALATCAKDPSTL